MPPGRRCIVIGAGLVGLSAAWSLSRRGWSVDVLEAADGIGHALAGSKGDARIFRLGYPKQHYVAMASAAAGLWRELEEESGRRLLRVTGQLSFGEAEALESLAASLTGNGEEVALLTRRDAEERFPGVAVPGTSLFEPRSGVLAAGECLHALVDAGRFHLQPRAHVTRIEDDGDGVTVRCGDGRVLRTDVVVNCAGPDALGLLGDRGRRIGATPSLPQVAYFDAARAGGSDPARLPVFIEWDATMVYGLPVFGSGPHAGTFKVSHHTPGPPLPAYDPSATATATAIATAASAAALDADDPAHLHTLTDAVRRLLPGLDPEPVATERCLYDNSADTDFVLDRCGNVVVGCGTSGHGFKFGPLLGELLADLAGGTTPRFDLNPFRVDRTGPETPPGQERSRAH